MSSISSKIWGRSTEILSTPFVELHHIHIKASSHCSEHLHRFKTNLFYCLKGAIKVRVWRSGKSGLIDETMLLPGDSTKVEPNLYHQFVTPKMSELKELFPDWDEEKDLIEAVELYFPERISRSDIERRSEGGSLYTKDV